MDEPLQRIERLEPSMVTRDLGKGTVPARVAAVLIALIAALTVGGSVGYALAHTGVTSGPQTRVLVGTRRQIDTCIYVGGCKGC